MARIDAQLNAYNVARMMEAPARSFSDLRIDSNNDCNVRCVYCHNHRSDAVVTLSDLAEFFGSKVVRVSRLQVGCIMEPTLDPRLASVLDLVQRSAVRPTEALTLQTNGICLDRHDLARVRDAGLTHLALSIDAVDPALTRSLRGGTNIAKVTRNLRQFRSTCPRIAITFVTTVTTANIGHLDELVSFGIDSGASRFVFRAVLYRPDSDVVNHARMPSLVLAAGHLDAARAALESRFGGRATLEFADEAQLVAHEASTTAASFR